MNTFRVWFVNQHGGLNSYVADMATEADVRADAERRSLVVQSVVNLSQATDDFDPLLEKYGTGAVSIAMPPDNIGS
jgi:hypothetical protein